MADPVPSSALYRLMTFLSPAFPVGAFTYSHGLEQAVEDGTVTCRTDLEAWLGDILRFGAGRNDAILLTQALRAARAGDSQAVEDLRALGLALQPASERYLETSAQGTALFDAITKSWLPDAGAPAADLLRGLAAQTDRGPWPYPAGLGLVCAAHGIPEDAAVTSFLNAFAANLVSAAIRTVPLGQTDGQTVIAALEPTVFAVASEAASAGLDDLGSAVFLADIASMAHETQYSRLFRS